MGFKGLLHGFQKGVYNDDYFRLDPDCLTSEESNQQMLFIYNFIN